MRARPHAALEWTWGCLLLLATLGLVLAFLGGAGERAAVAGPNVTLVRDSDRDGLPDVVETAFFGTYPLDPDADGDGYTDGLERALGADPLDAASVPTATAGSRILVVPEGPQVHLLFLSAAVGGLADIAAERILFATRGRGQSTWSTLDVTKALLPQMQTLTDRAGRVRCRVFTVSRKDVDLWCVGYGFRVDGQPAADGVVVQRRQGGLVFTIRFQSGEGGFLRARLEWTEPAPTAGTAPGGFKECAQVAASFAPNSPVRYILSEKCETRDQYRCPPDCGALTGHAVLDLGQAWLY